MLHSDLYGTTANRTFFFVIINLIPLFLRHSQSGTTGNPKGVMLNHDNLTWISHNLATYMNVRDGKDTFLSYLPLSHIAAQVKRNFKKIFLEI